MTAIEESLAHPRGGHIGLALRDAASRAVATGAWEVPAVVAVGFFAALLYVWNLTISGFANTYYSAAALAASQSWSAWFFGSLDPSNFITVDKPPLATMLMGLSVRLFGLSSWSVLLPEALAGVGSVLVLFALVRRSFGPAAGIFAAVAMAITPVAVLMFRYNNPDALLTFLLLAATWALLRALDSPRLWWLVLSGGLVGLAFLTKYLQAYLVLPAFATTWAIAAHAGVRRRVAGLVVAAVSVVVASGWWVAIVQLLPASARPYIGGSTDGTPLDLLLGYDGLGRLFGETGPFGGGGQNFSGEPGLLRLFNAEFGGQIAWLIPLALVALVTGLWIHRRAPRTGRARTGYLLWGIWLATHALVFSLMSGIIHTYYAVVLAPAIAALAGAGVVELWRLRRRTALGGLLLGGAIALTGAGAALLLGRSPDFAPGLGVAIVALSAAAAIVLAIPANFEVTKWAPRAGVAVGLVAILAGPTSYSLDTMNAAIAGGDPSAGPAVAGGGGFGGGGRGFVGNGGGFGFVAPAGAPGGGSGTPGGPGPGGETLDQTVLDYLVANRGSAKWIVATTSSGNAAGIQLATEQPVMAMGGFSGSDPAPTLDQLKALVASGDLRFVIVGGRGGPGGGGDNTARDNWVSQTCSPVNLGSTTTTLYNCAGAT